MNDKEYDDWRLDNGETDEGVCQICDCDLHIDEGCEAPGFEFICKHCKDAVEQERILEEKDLYHSIYNYLSIINMRLQFVKKKKEISKEEIDSLLTASEDIYTHLELLRTFK